MCVYCADRSCDYRHDLTFVSRDSYASGTADVCEARVTGIFISLPVSAMGGLVLGSRVVSVLDSGAEGPGSNRSRDAVG